MALHPAIIVFHFLCTMVQEDMLISRKTTL
jgi:hypothetical protein